MVGSPYKEQSVSCSGSWRCRVHYEQDARITADGKCAAWEGRRSIISVTDGFTRSERTAPGAPPLESMRAVLEYGLLLEERALPGAWGIPGMVQMGLGVWNYGREGCTSV